MSAPVGDGVDRNGGYPAADGGPAAGNRGDRYGAPDTFDPITDVEQPAARSLVDVESSSVVGDRHDDLAGAVGAEPTVDLDPDGGGTRMLARVLHRLQT